jgi:hypothetical protein
MNKEELIQKITSKREFSQLPRKDVEVAFSQFDKEQFSDEEKVKKTRDLLRKVFSVFTSEKLLKDREYDSEWILKKHVSTRERFGNYEDIYSKILRDIQGKISVIDLGAGVNGFSYKYFGEKTSYIGVEAIGQLVDLMNRYFKRERIDAKAIHASLFELDRIKKLISEAKGKKIVLLFKVLDSLEMLERDYSKKILSEIVPLSDEIVVSFATRSLISRKKFYANRNWIFNFIKERFKMLDDFEIGGERYLIFKK